MYPPTVDDEDADERQKFQDEAAFAAHVRALHAAQRRGDLRAQAAALTNLGLLYTAYGQVDDALRVYRAAYARSRRVGDQQACARVLTHVAQMWLDVGNLTQALAVQQQVLTCYHDLGDRRGQAEACIGLGHVYAAMGNMGHALEALHAALHQYACLKDRRGQADAVCLRDESEQMAVAIETPRAPLHSDVEARLVVPVEQLVGNLPSGILVGEFEGL